MDRVHFEHIAEVRFARCYTLIVYQVGTPRGCTWFLKGHRKKLAPVRGYGEKVYLRTDRLGFRWFLVKKRKENIARKVAETVHSKAMGNFYVKVVSRYFPTFPYLSFSLCLFLKFLSFGSFFFLYFFVTPKKKERKKVVPDFARICILDETSCGKAERRDCFRLALGVWPAKTSPSFRCTCPLIISFFFLYIFIVSRSAFFLCLSS